jgi:hypothetical protein
MLFARGCTAQFVEEVKDKHNFVFGLRHFRGIYGRQHRQTLAIRSQIPRRPAEFGDPHTGIVGYENVISNSVRRSQDLAA